MSFERIEPPPQPRDPNREIFGEGDATDDNTPIEFDEMDNFLDDIVGQIEYIDGITLTNITDIDKQFELEAEEAYNKALRDTTYNPDTDPEIDREPPQRSKRPYKDKEHMKQLIAQCDLLGFPRQDAVDFINKILNPEDVPDVPKFTLRMYDGWILKLKEHKQLFFEYYSRAGIFEDVYDVRATLKMVYQNLARQFRMEVMKVDKKDKLYIIKLAETINTMSDEMMRVSMASPFVQGFKSLMDYKNRIIDEVQRVHPNILTELGIKPLSTQLSIPAKARSPTDGLTGDAEVIDEGTVLEQPEEDATGSGDRERDIQKPAITGRIPEGNRTTRDRVNERIFG